jgi:hypothetical protein
VIRPTTPETDHPSSNNGQHSDPSSSFIETISEDEQEFHTKIVEKMKWAQEAQGEINSVTATWQSWGKHLSEKYGLGDVGRIDPDGTIIREA